MTSQPTTFKYFAFISYSRKDSKVAAWLQKSLEWFRFPVKLVPEDRRPPNPRYVRPIYRDKTNLPVTVDSYWKDICIALEESRFLIVLCSPNSAKPRPEATEHPVDMEVSHFLATHNHDTSQLVPIIVSGNVTSSGEDAAFCPALRSLGEPLIARTLPTMVPDGDKDELDAWEQGFVSLVSYLLSLDRAAIGDHIQRETKRQAKVLRRRLLLVGAVSVIAVVAGLLAYKNGIEAGKQRDIAETQRNEAIRRRKEADEQRAEADTQRIQVTKERDKQDELLWSASRSDHATAMRATDDGKHAEALAYLERSVRLQSKNSSALDDSAALAFGTLAPVWRMRSILTFDDAVVCIDFHAGSRQLAIGTNDGGVRLFEVETGKEVAKIGLYENLYCVRFSPDGRWLAIGYGERNLGFMRIVNTASGEQHRFAYDSAVTSVSFSQDSRQLAAGTLSGQVNIRDLAPSQEVTTLKLEKRVSSVSLNHDGSRLAVGTGDIIGYLLDKNVGRGGVIRVIEVATGTELINVPFEDAVNAVEFNPGGHAVAAGSSLTLGTQVIEATSGKELLRVPSEGSADSVRYSPDGRWLATGSRGMGRVRVVDATTGKLVGKMVFEGEVTSVAFSPDGRWLAAGGVSAGGKGQVRLMEAMTANEINRIQLNSSINTADFSRDLQQMAVAGVGFSRIIETNTGRTIRDMELIERVEAIALSPDFHQFAVAHGPSYDGKVRILDARTGNEVAKFDDTGNVVRLAFSPDGRKILAGAVEGGIRGGGVRIIDLITGKQTLFKSPAAFAMYSPDGRTLVVGSWRLAGAGEILQLFDADDGKKTADIEASFNAAHGCFSADGRWLGVGSESGAQVIELQTGKTVLERRADESFTSMSLNSNGNLLAIGFGDSFRKGGVLIIEVATNKIIDRLACDSGVMNVAFSLDGRTLGVVTADSTAFLFDSLWFGGQQEPGSEAWRAALRLLAGYGFNLDGRLHLLPADDIKAAQDDLDATLTGPPWKGERWQKAVLHWWRATPERRTISPWTTEPVWRAMGRRLMSVAKVGFSIVKPTSILDAANAAPWHPLEPVSLARLEPQRDTNTKEILGSSIYLARLTLKRLRDADENLYGHDILAEYAAWASRIMNDELHLAPEALEAVDFALDLTPKDKQQPLIELRALIEQSR